MENKKISDNPFVWAMIGGFIFSISIMLAGIYWRENSSQLLYFLVSSTMLSAIACLMPVLDSFLRKEYTINKKGSEFILVLLISFAVLLFFRTTEWAFSKIRDADDLGQYGQVGDFVGGLFNPIISIITLLFVFSAFQMQRKELQNSEKALRDSKDAVNLQRQDNAKSLYLNYVEDQVKYWSEMCDKINKDIFRAENMNSGLSDIFIELITEADDNRKKYLSERDMLIFELKSLAGISDLPVATLAQQNRDFG